MNFLPVKRVTYPHGLEQPFQLRQVFCHLLHFPDTLGSDREKRWAQGGTENQGRAEGSHQYVVGHEDGNMALDVYSGGLAIEPLRESINKLTYGSGMDLLIKQKLKDFMFPGNY